MGEALGEAQGEAQGERLSGEALGRLGEGAKTGGRLRREAQG